jgi:hypothetical protein
MWTVKLINWLSINCNSIVCCGVNDMCCGNSCLGMCSCSWNNSCSIVFTWDASFNWATSFSINNGSDVSFWAWTVSQWNTLVGVTFACVCAATFTQWFSDQVFVDLTFWNSFWAGYLFTSSWFASVLSTAFIDDVSNFTFVGAASSSFVTADTLGGSDVIDSITSVSCAWFR